MTDRTPKGLGWRVWRALVSENDTPRGTRMDNVRQVARVAEFRSKTAERAKRDPRR